MPERALCALRVAVVGSGPAGIYAAEALIRSGVQVDVLEVLPAPYGLVRYGVAPDHPKIKSIVRVLRRVLETPGVRFIGNVRYGIDVTLEQLRAHYDGVLFATGSPNDRRLGIPGEDLIGSYPAVDFVSWYSAHPDFDREFPLDAESVAVIGAGNVALDVARVLAKGAPGLAMTDVPDHVLRALAGATTTDIHIIARRGPAEAKFTQVELRELGELTGVDLVVDPADLQLDDSGREAVQNRRQVRSMVQMFQQWSQRPLTGAPRRLHIHFLRRPTALLGTDRVEAVRLERLELDGTGNVRGTGQEETLAAQLVIRSIGYRGAALPDLPFDEAAGTVPNEHGRIERGVYVAGWIKRGPTGVIGTNKADAVDTVRTLLADELEPADRDPDAFIRLLEANEVPYVSWDGWLRLDAHELALGEGQGRERVKVHQLEAMLQLSAVRAALNGAAGIPEPAEHRSRPCPE